MPPQSDVMIPEGSLELKYFIVLVLIIGFAWEILFRGFLLWWLAPIVGMPIAILTSGLSYGLAHGWKSARRGFASIVSAILFAIGYALTGSLWWLIIIHIAMPTVGYFALRRQRVAQREAATM